MGEEMEGATQQAPHPGRQLRLEGIATMVAEAQRGANAGLSPERKNAACLVGRNSRGLRPDKRAMSDTIDCTRMSHLECQTPEEEPGEEAPALTSNDSSKPTWDRYDCINDCVSSLGVVTLLEGSVMALGCSVLPPACPVFIGAGTGAVLGACDAACDELEPQKAGGQSR